MFSPADVRIVYMGTSGFAVPPLEALLREGYSVVAAVSQPPRPAGRGRKLTAPPVMEAATRMGLPVLHPEKVRSPEALAQLAELRPDLIVVAAYAQILPRALLELPPRGCINVHASLLPRWRGASPIHASILAGDAVTGVSIMLMEPSMDTGPVVAQSATGIEDGERTPELEERLSMAGAALLTSVLPYYLDGHAAGVPQDQEMASYAPIIKKDDGLIDWSRPAVQIWRASRAYYPWPGAFTFWKGTRLKILRCRQAPEAWGGDAPGTVWMSGDGAVTVSTGSGTIILEEIAPQGGRAMSAAEFSRGHRDFAGSELG